MTGIDVSCAIGWAGTIIFGVCSVWLILDGAFDERAVEPAVVLNLQLDVVVSQSADSVDLGGTYQSNARFVNDINQG